ncbi:MAG: hypothetical protein Q7T29_02335 [Gallionella sp.]|nr:hypothetical protein [Gallionella sp.]
MCLLSFLLLAMLALVLTKVNEAQAATPTWQASSAIAASTGADVTVTLPAHAANDILLLQVVVRDVNDTIAWPAGWTQIATVDRGATARYWWAWKRAASAAEPNPLVNKNTATGDTYAAVTTYRGAITTGDPWEVKGTPNTSTVAGHVLNGITTLTAESLIVASLCGEDNTAASGTAFSATNPVSLAQVLYVESATGSDGTCTSGAGARTAAGATGNVTSTWTATVVGSGGIVLALKPQPPTVVSINMASANPTLPATAVAWTVTFSASVTGVDTSDFLLVQAGGVTGATLTSVTGGGTTWTVNANTGSGGGTLGLNLVDDDSIINAGGAPLGGPGAGNGNFTGQVYTVFSCSPPPNTPGGLTLTCVCDTFGRASLNPSTIFNGNFSLSNSDGISNPYINAVTGLLRLTENTGNNAKAATVPGIFPAAGNYISVEFMHYAYQGGNPGADGIAVTLSDFSIPAVPGGFGGSLGYAQNTSGAFPGFAGGWVGVALDEYGNFQNPTEGRVLGPGLIVQSVGVRGPGSGLNGYRYMGGTASNPGGLSISANSVTATPAPGYMYQVIVDARNYGTGTVDVSVNRDATTKNGSTYTSIFGPFNAYTEANYALGQGWIAKLVPDYWKISFTGSTGGSINVHEIGSLRVCAQTALPPTGGTASGFSAIDEAYPGAPTVPAYPNFQTGNIYMKLVGTPFKFWVAALTGTGISTGYSAVSAKYLQVKLVDNTDNACGPDSARTCVAACTNKAGVEAGATQIATFALGSATGVASPYPSPTFTLNSSYKNLIAVMKECTTSACAAFTATAPACSADSFSVRPLSVASVISSNATNAATTGTPIFKAVSDNFSLTATTTGVAGSPSGYNGIMKINNAVVQAAAPATVAGTVAGSFPAAASATPSSTATGATFTYSEVGGFILPGYNPATDTTSRRGVYDGVSTVDECTTPGLTTAQCDALKALTWTGLDSISTKGDCVADSYSNVKVAGKYGCNFGQLSNTAVIGRFVPDHFDTVVTPGMPCPTALTCPTLIVANDQGFMYSGQPFTTQVTALNASGAATLNYDSAKTLSKPVTLTAWDAAGGATQNPGGGTPTLNTVPSTAFNLGVATTSTPIYTFPTTPVAPTNIHVRAVDTDNVTSLRGVSSIEGGIKVVSGRVRISNAHGSELLPLPMTATVQYWNSANWVTSTTDNATSFDTRLNTAGGNVVPVIVKLPLALGNISVVGAGVVTVANGVRVFNLDSPNVTGSADISLNAPSYLLAGSNVAGVNPSRAGRATFGVYKGANEFIYLRENY